MTPQILNLDDVDSSYSDENYGDLLYGLIRTHNPKLVVELGTYKGYSALHFAAALRDNKSLSQLHLLDLWEQYPYRHCSLEETRTAFDKNHLLDMPGCEILFHDIDAFKGSTKFGSGTIDFLHVDVSNTGANLEPLLKHWTPKLTRSKKTLVLLEGGSAERDQISWMMEYNMEPIATFLNSKWLNDRFSYFCFQPFPSITVLRFRDDSIT